MTKKFAISVLFLAFSLSALAQTESTPVEKKKGRPNIPGTFAVDLGFNLPTEREGFYTGIFGSRTLNLYYFYDYQIGKSKFSTHLGIGFGLERYKFNNNKTLKYVAGPSSPYDTLRMTSITTFLSTSNIKKTGFVTNYIDVPFEFRFNSNPNDLGRSFKVSLGFKFGFLYESFTKIKYRQNGETMKLKDKQNFNVNPIRYGVTGRIGAGNISIFAYYSLTPLFKAGKSPNDGASPYNDITNFSVGLTLAAF